MQLVLCNVGEVSIVLIIVVCLPGKRAALPQQHNVMTYNVIQSHKYIFRNIYLCIYIFIHILQCGVFILSRVYYMKVFVKDHLHRNMCLFYRFFTYIPLVQI